jgi:ABC-2 type transport system ATP-binding protein
VNPAGDAVVEARQLTKHFGAVVAVESLDFEVGRGEVFGFLGPNGAGKTTTIRLCLDLVRPTSGSVRVLGGSGRDPAVRRRIGYLPGDLRLDPRYTATEVIDFFGALRGGVDGASVGQLLDRFDLDPTRRVGELSTGNRRKVGIVAAFAHRPELLILDEPTAGLDPLLQYEFQQLVRQAVDGGATVLLSSHILPEVEVLADRVGIIRRGRLAAVAGIDELRAQARQRIDLHVVGMADPAIFAGLSEIVSLSNADGLVQVVVEGTVDRVLKAAAGLEVRRIVTHEADLEEVFLGYYRDDRT